LAKKTSIPKFKIITKNLIAVDLEGQGHKGKNHQPCRKEKISVIVLQK
jgi:hypothetical protein